MLFTITTQGHHIYTSIPGLAGLAGPRSATPRSAASALLYPPTSSLPPHTSFFPPPPSPSPSSPSTPPLCTSPPPDPLADDADIGRDPSLDRAADTGLEWDEGEPGLDRDAEPGLEWDEGEPGLDRAADPGRVRAADPGRELGEWRELDADEGLEEASALTAKSLLLPPTASGDSARPSPVSRCSGVRQRSPGASLMRRSSMTESHCDRGEGRGGEVDTVNGRRWGLERVVDKVREMEMLDAHTHIQ